MRNILKIILVLVIIFLLILLTFYLSNRHNNETNNTIKLLEEISDKDSNIKENLENKSDIDKNTVIATVNDTKITEIDYALHESLNNNLNEEKNKILNVENTTKELIKENIILEEVKKSNLNLTNEDTERINSMVDSLEDDDIKSSAEELNMNTDEYKEKLKDNFLNKKLIEEWKYNVYLSILNNELNIEYKNFKEKNEEFQKLVQKYNKKEIEKFPLSKLYEVYNIYMDYLMLNYNVEIQ